MFRKTYFRWQNNLFLHITHFTDLLTRTKKFYITSPAYFYIKEECATKHTNISTCQKNLFKVTKEIFIACYFFSNIRTCTEI